LTGVGVARFIFIVARQLPRVYEHLSRQFASEPNVQVVMDRRKGGRSLGPPADERRRNVDADEQLRVMGYAFVRLTDSADAGR
jgi:hypothetical protein